jgi:hypothetical protein
MFVIAVRRPIHPMTDNVRRQGSSFWICPCCKTICTDNDAACPMGCDDDERPEPWEDDYPDYPFEDYFAQEPYDDD